MNITEIICVSSFIITLVLFVFTVMFNFKKIRDEQKEEGAKEAQINTKLENLIIVNNTMSAQMSLIMDKMDNQNVRMTKLEQIIENANLKEMPTKIAELESSVKSAHHRIDELKQSNK